MLSRQQCTQLLGEERVYDIVKKLKAKNINQETTDRVLDYLACHSQAFPFLDSKATEDRLINNIQTNIVYQDMLTFGRERYKQTKDLPGSVVSALTSGARTSGQSIILKKDPLRFIKPKALTEQRTDSIIRHELDHMATTTISEPLSESETKSILKKNADAMAATLHADVNELLAQDIDSAAKELAGQCKFVSGIAGSTNNVFDFGNTALNEGVTAYKTKKLDQVADPDLKPKQSGYRINEKVATYMIQKVGEEKFLTMQADNDFAGITTAFMEATEKTPEYMADFYKHLDIETGQEKTTLLDTLTRKVRNGLGLNVRHNNTLLQTINQEVELN